MGETWYGNPIFQFWKKEYVVTFLLVILFAFIFTHGEAIARRIDNSNQLIDKLLCLKRMSSGLWVIIISALCAGLVSRAANGLELTEFILTVLVLALLDGATGLRSIWLLLVLVLQECRGRTHIVTMHR